MRPPGQGWQHPRSAVLRPLLTSAQSTRHLAMRAVGAAQRQHNRHPGRPPRIRTINFPLRPPRLRCDPVDGDGLRPLEQAHPDRPAFYGSCSSVQSFALGFLPTPPHDGAVTSGSELAPPLPPGDFHPQSIAHAGRTQERRCGGADVAGCVVLLACLLGPVPLAARGLPAVLARAGPLGAVVDLCAYELPRGVSP
jgi:hypothetical protein